MTRFIDLSEEEKEKQRAVVRDLIGHGPYTDDETIDMVILLEEDHDGADKLDYAEMATTKDQKNSFEINKQSALFNQRKRPSKPSNYNDFQDVTTAPGHEEGNSNYGREFDAGNYGLTREDSEFNTDFPGGNLWRQPFQVAQQQSIVSDVPNPLHSSPGQSEEESGSLYDNTDYSAIINTLDDQAGRKLTPQERIVNSAISTYEDRGARQDFSLNGVLKRGSLGNFKEKSYKCNALVERVLLNAGIEPPRYAKNDKGEQWPIKANVWGNPNFHIPGWEIVESPMPGDIMALPTGDNSSSGHVGVVTDVYGENNGLGVSARTGENGLSLDNSMWRFGPQRPKVYRRYVGEGAVLNRNDENEW